MEHMSIELPGSLIKGVVQEGNTVRVQFEPAYLIKTMTGSKERTSWHQNGDLVFQDAEIEGDLPDLPAECTGGDVGENVYTYRDMLPVPLDSRGRASCVLKVLGSPAVINVTGTAIKLEMYLAPKYIEHIRPESA